MDSGSLYNLMTGLLEASLKSAPIVRRGEYNYFIHPITDGIPCLEPQLLQEVTERIIAALKDDFDKILTIEAMGIVLGTALSLKINKPLSIVRKRSYNLPDELEVDQSTGYSRGKLYLNGISQGERLVIIDDVISTGGTLRGVWRGAWHLGATIVDSVVVIERGDGAAQLRNDGLPVKALVKIEVDSNGIKIIE